MKKEKIMYFCAKNNSLGKISLCNKQETIIYCLQDAFSVQCMQMLFILGFE